MRLGGNPKGNSLCVKIRFYQMELIQYGDSNSIFFTIVFKMIQNKSSTSIISFIFQNQNNYQSESQQATVANDLKQIDIRHIIDSFKQKHSIFMPLEWKIYDPQTYAYKTIDVEKPLNEIYLLSPVIMLKYKELSFPDSDVESINSSKGQGETKKERNKQRTIREVIQCVKQWRQIHNSLDKYKNKINLYDAAKIVGIAKKSLDDYFCQLRLAEEYGFDFDRNMNQKIGVLRSFVRKSRPKGEVSLKHERLPRKLRIIQQFNIGSGAISKYESQQKIQMMEEEIIETVMQTEYEPPMAVIPEDELENRFLSSFNFMIDDPNDDPFINYGFSRSNSKIGAVDPEEFLFF